MTSTIEIAMNLRFSYKLSVKFSHIFALDRILKKCHEFKINEDSLLVTIGKIGTKNRPFYFVHFL